MERWQNKIALVTGSNAGIGAACAIELVKAGLTVIGLDRDEVFHGHIPNDRLILLKCDITNEESVLKNFELIKRKFGGVDILINNAGIVRNVKLLQENNTTDLKAILDTNVLGVAYCTREAFKSMQSRNVDGHVININSITGHYIPPSDGRFSFNIYPASKHALTAMTEIYRREFLELNTKVKVTSISPGAVKTDILKQTNSSDIFENIKHLTPKNVADAIIYVLQTPRNVEIQELTIRPIGEKL